MLLKTIEWIVAPVVAGLFLILALLYCYGLIRLFIYERKLNQLYKKLEVDVSNAKQMGETISFAEGEVAKAREIIRPQIEELERKRRFLLDKLPLIKK